MSQLGLANHTMRFTSTVRLSESGEVSATLGRLQRAAKGRMGGANLALERTAEYQEGELRVLVSFYRSDRILFCLESLLSHFRVP